MVPSISTISLYYYSFGDLADGYLYLGPIKDEPYATRMKNFVARETFEKWKKYFDLITDRELHSVEELNEILLHQEDLP